MTKRVAVGLIGPMLDSGISEKRWEKWRPSVALCQHEDLLIDRFVLLYQKKYTSLMELLTEDINRISPETLVTPVVVEFGDPWDFEGVYGALHDFTKTYPFDAENEEYLVHITTGTHVAQICLFLLTESHDIPGKLIQTIPPKGRSAEIQGDYTVIDLDLSRYDRIATRFQKKTEDDLSFLKSGIETRNPSFNRLIEQVEKVAARSLDPILITGPTGAGKSRLARRIYELKKNRRQLAGAFVEVNCATIRGDAAMSTLFGHTRGSFTGASQDREGLLRTADKGLLFLDEIGELGLDEQAVLLRAVEEKRFLPVGADRESASDFQLICGTNRDLRKSVADGSFREDLLARINLWVFGLPGLADRPEDIEPNLSYELDRFSERHNRRVTFNREARELFLAFAVSPKAGWKGNFRDLNGAVTRMATLAEGGRITKADVEEETERLRENWNESERVHESLADTILGPGSSARLDRFERVQLEDVLSVCRESSSLSEAGRALFAVSRENRSSTNDADRLKKYLARFGIGWEMIGRIP
jgi:transcriptional regulatory protein RtcR